MSSENFSFILLTDISFSLFFSYCSFSSRRLLVSHVSDAHPSSLRLECPETGCGKLFSSPKYLQKHLTTVHRERKEKRRSAEEEEADEDEALSCLWDTLSVDDEERDESYEEANGKSAAKKKTPTTATTTTTTKKHTKRKESAVSVSTVEADDGGREKETVRTVTPQYTVYYDPDEDIEYTEVRQERSARERERRTCECDDREEQRQSEEHKVQVCVVCFPSHLFLFSFSPDCRRSVWSLRPRFLCTALCRREDLSLCNQSPLPIRFVWSSSSISLRFFS